MNFVDPKNDMAFKKIFGDSNRKDILISLLNAILNFKENKTIVSITLVNPYQMPEIPDFKETILDIKAINQDGQEFIVEMQKRDYKNFDKRSLYYASKAYVSQLNASKDYSSLKKVYFIGILNFNLFEGDKYISRHLILNKDSLKQELKDMEFAYIELPKFKKELCELSSNLDKWVYFFSNAENLKMIPAELSEPQPLKKALETANYQTWAKDELDIYEKITMDERATRSALEENIRKEADKRLKIEIEKSRQYGVEEGIEEGIQKGIQKGMQEGRQEGILTIAKNMKSNNIDTKTILECTGLSISEINNL